MSLFIVLMLILGIPHGATDHLVFFSSHKTTSYLDWIRFSGMYLGIMLIYILAWYFFPLACFIAFLAFSAYHFGQSQLYYFPISENSWLKIFLYFIWGSTVLLAILGFNASQSLSILEDTPFIGLMSYVFIWFVPLLGISVGLLLMGFLIAYIRENIPLKSIFQELGLLLLIVFLCWSTSLLWSFAIYFALWHSLQTIEQEIRVFRQKFSMDYTWKNYAQDAFLLSLISFVGIAFILSSLYFFELKISGLLFTFFILISILTAPHAWLIGNIYQK
jgi:Brp/Blh family beta-carotene 15,15'-monooxygenase